MCTGGAALLCNLARLWHFFPSRAVCTLATSSTAACTSSDSAMAVLCARQVSNPPLNCLFARGRVPARAEQACASKRCVLPKCKDWHRRLVHCAYMPGGRARWNKIADAGSLMVATCRSARRMLGRLVLHSVGHLAHMNRAWSQVQTQPIMQVRLPGLQRNDFNASLPSSRCQHALQLWPDHGLHHIRNCRPHIWPPTPHQPCQDAHQLAVTLAMLRQLQLAQSMQNRAQHRRILMRAPGTPLRLVTTAGRA